MRFPHARHIPFKRRSPSPSQVGAEIGNPPSVLLSPRGGRWNCGAALFLSLLITGCQTGFSVNDLLTKDPRKRGEALTELVRIPDEKIQEIIPVLTRTLSDPDTRRVDYASDALSVIGQPAVPALRKELKNEDVFARISATRVLGLLGTVAAPAVPDLLPLLKDPHPLVRDEAVQTLGYIGPPAKEAIPELKSLITNDNKEISEQVKKAIQRITG